ncbi:DUF3429 domain-containing protein [Spongiibacter nanhainus]|uniref:DUF3429 domain-containing protein n=1 Tax=Spongiibacter nanhainus TaxID=2794344 RepID=A0A7T4R007_9GAMM|nr:DUF3429 domain-containing protein [Spongiibacter nanhainus]QQD17817.1 DUF3429 domain-containing protein [Spongiibacter nanhainus]
MCDQHSSPTLRPFWYIVAGGLGSLPFVVASFGALVGGSWMGLTGEVALHSYGVAIAAFMAGTLWGGTFTVARFSDAMLGMVAALATAFTVWMPVYQSLATLSVILATLWAYDVFRYYRYALPRWYLSLRCTLSSVAIVSLMVPVLL